MEGDEEIDFDGVTLAAGRVLAEREDYPMGEGIVIEGHVSAV